MRRSAIPKAQQDFLADGDNLDAVGRAWLGRLLAYRDVAISTLMAALSSWFAR